MSKKLSIEYVDLNLENKNIKRLDNYVNCATVTTFQCLKNDCNYIWKTTVNSVLCRSGCPKCAGKAKLSNEIIDQRLVTRSIKTVENYINTNSPINFQCMICNHIWKAKPTSILDNQTGVP